MLKISPIKKEKVVYEDIDLTLAPEPKEDLVGTTYSGLGLSKVWAALPEGSRMEICETEREYEQYKLEQEFRSKGNIKLSDLKRK